MSEVIGKFPIELDLDVFFKKLLVTLKQNLQEIIGSTKYNEKVQEYSKSHYQTVKEQYKGPSVYYEDWCNFCKARGVQGSLITFALNLPLSCPAEKTGVEADYVYACGGCYSGETLKIRRSGNGRLQLPTGDVYEGAFKNGQRSGYGKFSYSNNTGYYEGNWLADLRHGPGEEQFPDGGRFQGIWKQGKQTYGTLDWGQAVFKYEGGFDGEHLDGYGIWTDSVKVIEGYWKNSLLEGQGQEQYIENPEWHYIGEWKKGRYHGKGELVNKIGEYKGNFMNGHYEGYGVLLYKGGGKYSGDWKSGLFHGQGEYVNTKGETYIGSFSEGKKQGVGRMQYRNGAVYDGSWREDCRHGTGEMCWKSGDCYVGDFCNDKYEGKGKLLINVSDSHEEIYEGGFKNGLAEGSGTLIRVYEETVDFVVVKKREVYKGDFVEGEFNGNGTYTYKDCSQYVGQWKNGLREGIGKLFGGKGEVIYEGLFVKGLPATQVQPIH